MALPSIVLMLALAGGVAATMIGVLVEHGEAIFGEDPGDAVAGLLMGGMALVTAGATWFHWKRFMVPITVAAGAAALAATAVALVLSITGMPAEPDALVMSLGLVAEIGRAWCRERVCQYV